MPMGLCNHNLLVTPQREVLGLWIVLDLHTGTPIPDLRYFHLGQRCGLRVPPLEEVHVRIIISVASDRFASRFAVRTHQHGAHPLQEQP